MSEIDEQPKLPKNITLETFVEQLKRDIDAFAKWYESKADASRNTDAPYPLQMWPGDWFENFCIFQDMSEEERRGEVESS